MSPAQARAALLAAISQAGLPEADETALVDLVKALDLAWRQDMDRRKRQLEAALRAPTAGPGRKPYEQLHHAVSVYAAVVTDLAVAQETVAHARQVRADVTKE